MKRLVSILAVLLVTLLISTAAIALEDTEWKAQQTAAQGYYAEDLTQEALDALNVTTIYQSDDSPTGYFVTFRYQDAEAERVRIRGEWSLADKYSVTTEGIVYYEPEEWTTDMFALIPDIQGDWPAYDMVKNEETGVWAYTIPLSSGTWSYRFIVGGVEGAEMKDYTDAVQTTDPNNPPFEANLGDQNNSQVRVPFDADKQIYDYSVQLPIAGDQAGVAEIVFYPIAGLEGVEDGEYELCVYLPAGYDAGCAEPYKVLYLSHGGGVESATSWYNKGSVGYMMDNLVAEGKVEPFIVVIMNNYAVEFNYENLPANIIPFVEANYNVVGDKSGRAVAGLSAGGRYTLNTLINHPEVAGYYGLFSASGDLEFELNAEELADARIYLSMGMQEFAHKDRAINRIALMYRLYELGMPFDFHAPEGGHQWTVWREEFVDFCTMTLWK